MLTYIYKALHYFSDAFSRRSTWLLFCMLVLGFMGAGEITGISSFCRFWGVGDNAYHSFLNFFRSSAFSIEGLLFFWGSFVLAQNETVRVQGRAVMIGDHTSVPKDGRRMPGVVTIRQESETQTKPSRFRGHFWGSVCLLTGSLAAPFATPLALRIHQGFVHIGQGPKGSCLTLGTRIVHMAVEFAMRHDILCVLVLDAYFPSSAVFILAASVWSVEFQQPLVTLIIRAKKNCTACFPAEKPEGKNPVGRPRKYGEEVKVRELFDYEHLFATVRCCIYGKIEDVSVAAFDLIWKPSGSSGFLLRFVLAVTSHGPVALMCSDPNQDPRAALELYCTRIRVEVMFDILKNLICAFSYRFWSKLMLRHSRRPLKNRNLKEPSSEVLPTVRLCWDAYERFVMIGAIAQGLLQMVSLKFGNLVWNHSDIFMRTRSRELPSERTVRTVIIRLLITDIFLSSAPGTIIGKIRERYSGKKSFPRYADPPDEPDDRMTA
jgi:hypothetical protein